MSDLRYSIIIPVYNSQKKLCHCINSVLKQTYHNFELILVDDGSTDSSLEICYSFKNIDNRIKVYTKQNGGVSSARNLGLNNSSGEYIIFIDSDDFVDINMLQEFNKYDADLVIQGFFDYADEKIIKTLIDDYDEWKIYDDRDILKFLHLKSSVFVWGKKYKNSIIKNNGIMFREDMKCNEDNIFNNDYLMCINSIVNIKYGGYFHCQYKIPTLSNINDNKSFLEKNKWRMLAYDQYKKYPKVQELFVKQFLFFAEKEIESICSSNRNFFEKRKLVSNILSNSFFQEKVKHYPEYITKKYVYLYEMKFSTLLIFILELKKLIVKLIKK